MRTYCIAQVTLLSALWGPEYEGNQKRGGIHKHVAHSLCRIAETSTLQSNYTPTKINKK